MQRNIFLILLIAISLSTTASTLYYRSMLYSLTQDQKQKEAEILTTLQTLHTLMQDVQVATYPTPCDQKSRRILGEECDVGNYMEWAAPLMVHTTETLISSMHYQPKD